MGMVQLALGLIASHPSEGERLARFFAEHGFGVERHERLDHFLVRLALQPPHLVMVVAPEPGQSPALLRQLREHTRLPVVILGGQDDISPVMMLEAGADDVLDRSTPLRAVLARIRAILRRAEWGLAEGSRAVVVDGWQMLAARRQLLRPDGSECALTTAEFDLMQLLLENRGRSVDRDIIATRVFHRPFRAEDRTVDNLVLRLRRKLGDTDQVAIKTVRGAGYMFTNFCQSEDSVRRVA
jgi:DNA-binding response OmpR family regulator